MPLALLIVGKDAAACRASADDTGSMAITVRSALKQADFGRSLFFIGYLLAIIVVTYIAGQLVALPLFVATYLLTWGRYKVPLAAGYAAVTFIVIWSFYGQLMNLLFHSSLLFG